MEQLPKTTSASGELENSPSNGLNDLRQELREVTGELKKLIEKKGGEKKKDRWDKFQIISSFFSTVLLAAVGLFFTLEYKDRESIRQADMHNVQIRIAELQAISGLTPLLASKDEEVKRIATLALRALKESGPVSSSSEKKHEIRVLDTFVKIAFADTASVDDRNKATRNIVEIALDAGAPPNIREKATDAVTALAVSPKVPSQTREIANEALKQIRMVNPDEISDVVAGQKNDREIDEIILHHNGEPGIDSYRGAKTIFAIAEYMTLGIGWSNVGWHYNIAPDGNIWLGTPLGKVASHVASRNKTSVGVTLFIDGDKELPTEAQKKSLAILLLALFDKLKIDPQINFGPGKGFHSDYSHKSCPGRLITKEMVLDWLKVDGR